MSKKRITTLILLLLLLGLWWAVIHVPSVERTFWDFCTLGILPWSGKPISSEALWRWLIGCFTVSFMVIFRKEIMASLPKRQHKTHLQAELPAAPQPLPTPVNVRKRDAIVITIANAVHKPQRHYMRPFLLVAARICIAGVTIGDGMERAVRLVARSAIKYGSMLFWGMVHVLWRVSLAVATATILIGKLVEPYVRRFDRWLNVRLHRNPTTARMLRVSNDAWKTTSSTYKKLQQSSSKASQLK
jgi:hypothetical protein